MAQMTLHERYENWNESLSLDLENRLVQNVALAGQFSRNGYRYGDDTLAGAVGLYEGKPVFLDHASTRERPQERSTRDLVGSIVNARYVSGRVRGDIRVLDTASGELFLKLVESPANGVGMSHVVLAERSQDGKSVLHIRDVLSVDVVVNPATTTTFAESINNSPIALSAEAVDAAAASEQPDWAELLQERNTLRAEISELRKQAAIAADREVVEQLLAHSGLPAEMITECFRRQLLQTPEAGWREQLLQDRLQLAGLRRQTAVAVVSEARSKSSAADSEAEFLHVLKRRA